MIGCAKCNHTGFAYGKIPCVCRDEVPKSRQMATQLIASAISVGDLIYYDGNLLGEVTEIDLECQILQVKVPKFMGYGQLPELSWDYVNVNLDDPKVTRHD
jgi:hypothetical protein